MPKPTDKVKKAKRFFMKDSDGNHVVGSDGQPLVVVRMEALKKGIFRCIDPDSGVEYKVHAKQLERVVEEDNGEANGDGEE